MDSYEEQELKKFFWKYEQALKYLDLVMESYVSSLEISDEHNPVEHYKGRIKNIDSIRKKLAKKGFEFTIKNMEEQLHDIAGIRIVCHFRNDLNELIEIFKNNPNISVVEEEDYITNPKKSGYLSYHMTVKVPVVDEAKIVMVPAEIQIRTLLMDLPASLEHKTRYKKEWSLPKEMDKNITEISELSSQVDEELERRINSLINVGTRTKSPNSIIYDMNFNNVINDEMMIKYSMALEKLKYMIEREIFGNSNRDGEDIIDNIKFRLKTKKSTVKKLLSKGFEVNEENIAKELSDVVGARIVCSFISDMPSIIDKICNYKEDKIQELLQNEKIIRNKLKINATINNSKIFKKIQQEYGTFYNYLKTFTQEQIIYETDKTTNQLSDVLSKDLQKRGMKFVGSTIIYSYLQAIGVIYSHDKDCFLYKEN